MNLYMSSLHHRFLFCFVAGSILIGCGERMRGQPAAGDMHHHDAHLPDAGDAGATGDTDARDAQMTCEPDCDALDAQTADTSPDLGPTCGNATCDEGETCMNCPRDCGECPPAPTGDGIWISQDELMELPTSGPGWENVLEQADSDCGTPDLADQDDDTNVCIMATALVAARTDDDGYRQQVLDAITALVDAPTYEGRALALGRELAAYVIAADVIGLETVDPALDADFRDKLLELRTTPTDQGPGDLVECHEVRPNNWGTHCGASRLAVALYLDRDEEVERIAEILHGWMGNRDVYSDESTPGFRYGDDLSWQCDADRPVGINPAGCVIDGHDVGGIQPEEQRRCGSFQWPPCESGYQWEGLQGPLAQAWMLHRAGYPAFEWEDQALLRAFVFLHDVAGQIAEGDDQWLPYIVNHVYGTDFPTTASARAGKNAGWTDWTLP